MPISVITALPHSVWISRWGWVHLGCCWLRGRRKACLSILNCLKWYNSLLCCQQVIQVSAYMSELISCIFLRRLRDSRGTTSRCSRSHATRPHLIPGQRPQLIPVVTTVIGVITHQCHANQSDKLVCVSITVWYQKGRHQLVKNCIWNVNREHRNCRINRSYRSIQYEQKGRDSRTIAIWKRLTDIMSHNDLRSHALKTSDNGFVKPLLNF